MPLRSSAPVPGAPGRLSRAWQHVLDFAYAAYWELRHVVAPGEVGRYSPGTLDPVLLLPGVYETWEFLRPLADELAARGHPIHVVPGFGHNRGTIPEMASLAQHYLDERDLRRVIVVAHSKGGLIGKQMMVNTDAESRILRIIAVNSPFGGSPYAHLSLRPALREFSPTGVTLAALSLELAVNKRIVSIYSESDLLIPGGGELAGATNIRLPLIGHFRPLSSQRLISEVECLVGSGERS